jgi:hypothetical protein
LFSWQNHTVFLSFFSQPSYSFSRLFTISAQLLTIFLIVSFVFMIFAENIIIIIWNTFICFVFIYFVFFSQSLLLINGILGTKDWTSIFEKINLQQERRLIRQYWIKTRCSNFESTQWCFKSGIWGDKVGDNAVDVHFIISENITLIPNASIWPLMK